MKTTLEILLGRRWERRITVEGRTLAGAWRRMLDTHPGLLSTHGPALESALEHLRAGAEEFGETVDGNPALNILVRTGGMTGARLPDVGA